MFESLVKKLSSESKPAQGGLEKGFKETVENNPIVNSLLDLLENLVKYEQLQEADSENIRKLVEIRKADIESEIKSIKKELETIDSDELRDFKRQKLEILEVQHKKLSLL